MRRQRSIPTHPSRSVTIREVASTAGVSTATVSRVLAGLGGAGPEVKKRVLAAVRSLRYEPNRLAQGLRARERKVIGILLPDLQNPFFTGVVAGAEQILWEAGYSIQLCHSDGQADREQSHFGVLRGEGIAGLIIIPANEGKADYAELGSWSAPTVAVDRAPRGLRVDLVRITNREGAREATAHLVGLGYASIGLINGPSGFDVSRDRLKGFREGLESGGVVLERDLLEHGDFRQESGYAAMNRLLRLPHPPRALLIANNLMTLGALRAIHECGVRIPDELALICFDDMPWATSLRPPLTAVAQPAQELGQTAARLLLERLQTPGGPPREIVLPTRLVVRASCGAANRQHQRATPGTRQYEIQQRQHLKFKVPQRNP